MWPLIHVLSLPMLPHQAALLALPILLFFIVALVVGLASLGERNLDLGPSTAVEIDGERHERHALAGHSAMQFRNLAMVEQQFARPLGLVVESVAVAEFRDVGVDQPDFLVLHLGIAFGDRSLAEAKALHLGAGQRDAGLIFVLDSI